MAISASLEATDTSRRGAARRTLRFETVGEGASGDATPVRVHNASNTGLLMESESELAVGDALDIDLPHVGVTVAQVVWASGQLYGCRFDEPISDAALSAAQLRSDVGLDVDRRTGLGTESLGARLHRLRTQRGLTLSQLAAQLDVSKPTIWAWEKGKAHPLEARLPAIAEALGVPASELADLQDGEARQVLERSREAIASAFGTEPSKIRIMIEL